MASCAGACMTETAGVSPGATGEAATVDCVRADTSAIARARALSCAGKYSRCGRLRTHHALKWVQITRTRMRTDAVGACVVLAAAMGLRSTLLALALPEILLFTTGCDGSVDSVERTGSALLTPGWVVPPQASPAHLRAGSSFGTGGGAMVTNGGFDVIGGVEIDGGFNVGGIVAGG